MANVDSQRRLTTSWADCVIPERWPDVLTRSARRQRRTSFIFSLAASVRILFAFRAQKNEPLGSPRLCRFRRRLTRRSQSISKKYLHNASITAAATPQVSIALRRFHWYSGPGQGRSGRTSSILCRRPMVSATGRDQRFRFDKATSNRTTPTASTAANTPITMTMTAYMRDAVPPSHPRASH
jgi:hypothetical protein